MATILIMVEARKAFYLICGSGLVGLATLGIFLPLLPTTPLLLLAAACFAKSSDRCHRWLMNHRVFGSILRNWDQNRCIPLRAKVIAISAILLFGIYAVGVAVEHPVIRIAGGFLLLTGLIVVSRIPSCREED